MNSTETFTSLYWEDDEEQTDQGESEQMLLIYHVNQAIDRSKIGAPGCLSWLSTWLLVSAQVMISWFVFKPRFGLCADSVEPAGDILFVCLSLSQRNK